MNTADRLPPHSRDAERSLLSSMLRDNNVIPEAVGMVRADDFYVFGHQKIYEAITLLNDDAGKPADVVTVAEQLIKTNLIDEVGGAPYLADLWDSAPSAAHYQQYAQIIREHAVSRRLIHVCSDLQAQAFDPTKAPAELLDQAERSILDIAERAIVGQTQTLQQALAGAYRALDERKGRLDVQHGSGIPTGFIDLDSTLGGMQNSELVILAARPSVGKTSCALRIAANAAIDHGLPVLFVSLEQSKEALAERLLCIEGRIDSAKMRKGHISADDVERVMSTGAHIGDAKLFIDDTRGQTMLRIAANARRIHRRHGLRLLVIDYLQLIESDDRRKPEHEQISGISKRLTYLAGELKIPILALCQLNRESEAGAGRRPRMSDLRGSGSLEQDADAVILMSRPDATERSRVLVEVAKNRSGPTGDIDLMFDAKFMRFENWAMPMEGGKW